MKYSIQRKFGENYRRIRKNKKLSQDIVAERANVAPSYISELENGLANPTLSTIEKLANGIEVEVVDLFLFLNSQSTPERVRNRLKSILDKADDKSLQALNDIIVETFQP